MAMVLAAATVLAGCGSGNTGTSGQRFKTGNVRFLNAIPDSMPLDVAIERTPFARLAFGGASSNTSLNARGLRVDVGFAGLNGQSNTVIGKDRIVVRADRDLTVYLVGALADAELLSVETEPLTLAAGRAEVSFVHLSARRDDVELFLTDPAADLAGLSPSATLDFRDSTEPQDIASGSYRLRARVTGTTALLFDSGPFTLTDQSRRIFAVVDYFGPGTSPIRVIRIDGAGAALFPGETYPSTLAVANLVADGGRLDASLDDGATAQPIDNIDFPGVSGSLTTAAGTYTATLFSDDNPAAVVLQTAVPLLPAEQRTLVVTGISGSIQSRAIIDPVRPIAGQAGLRVIHAAPVASQVDFYLVARGAEVAGSTPFFTALPVLTSGELQVQPGEYDAVFTAAGSTDIVAGPLAIDVAAGSLSTLYTHDALGGGAPAAVIIFP
jgi:hypothetical protein